MCQNFYACCALLNLAIALRDGEWSGDPEDFVDVNGIGGPALYAGLNPVDLGEKNEAALERSPRPVPV